MTYANQLRHEGFQEGVEKRSFEIARGMIQEKINDSVIQKLTKLSPESIAKLRQDTK